jgi:hypothetical protein
VTNESLHRKLGSALLVLGSCLFVYGGAFHPKINSSLGQIGSAEFFQRFYEHIAHLGAWEFIHTLILLGPVLWLLGIDSFWWSENRWNNTARKAMTFAATAWAVTFIFDGFVAPFIVRMLPPEVGRSMLAANQVVVIRLGLVAWLMLGFSMVCGGVGVLITDPPRSRRVWSQVGMLLGTWPFVAWALGLFLPGPFTSRYWNATAVGTALWFLIAGVLAFSTKAAQHTATATGLQVSEAERSA